MNEALRDWALLCDNFNDKMILLNKTPMKSYFKTGGYVKYHKECTKHKQSLPTHRQPHKIKITLSDIGALLYMTKDGLDNTDG